VNVRVSPATTLPVALADRVSWVGVSVKTVVPPGMSVPATVEPTSAE
jgi:hypothetical protein